jgi:hypothetical protein
MALTRKLLAALGIEADKVDQIIEAHAETVEGLKSERDGYKAKAEQADALAKQVEELTASATPADKVADLEGKLAEAQKAYADLTAKVQGEKDAAAKDAAYRSDVLKAANIDPRRFDSVMRVTPLDGIELEGGHVKGADELAKKAAQEWADFVAVPGAVGANVSAPQASGNAIDFEALKGMSVQDIQSNLEAAIAAAKGA